MVKTRRREAVLRGKPMTRQMLWSSLGLVALCLTACSAKQPAGGVAEQSPANAEKPASSAVKGPPATAIGKGSKAAPKPFPDEPAAHALYNQMIGAMRKADSLSYVCHYQIRGKDNVPYGGTYSNT